MNDRLYQEIICMLDTELGGADLSNVSKRLTQILSQYEITAKSTELVVYDSLPMSVKAYLVSRKIEGASAKTLDLYKLRLTQFCRLVGKPIEQVGANDVRLFLYAYQEQSKCSDRTLDGFRTIISGFFKWANAEGYIEKNACAVIRPIKYTEREREALTEMEIEMLRRSASTLRNKAIIEFFFSTGCRVSELIGVKKSDINITRGEVTLFGKGSKYRTSYINIKAALAIAEYLNSRDDDSEYLFVTERRPYRPLTKSAIELLIEKMGIAAGLERHIHPHLIRHTTATLALQRGMDITEIQKLLGHANIATTMIYAKVADETVKNDHKKCIV